MCIQLKQASLTSARTVAAAARRALEEEALAAPKPGLVDRLDSGAHSDMDLLILLRSAEVLEPFFEKMYRCGFRAGGSRSGGTLSDLPGAFRRARLTGFEAEAVMFRTTAGVNTHKGAIFTLGLLSTALGYLQGVETDVALPAAACAAGVTVTGVVRVTADDVLDCAAKMVAGIVERELERPAERCGVRKETAGERLYRQHGIRGIRGEAEDGFPSLRTVGLPVLRRERELSATADEHCVQTLLYLMTVVEDTNVVARGGPEALSFVRTGARRVLDAGGVHRREGRLLLEELNRDFIERNISPGGSADLLSAALFLDSLAYPGRGLDTVMKRNYTGS